jgi:hypothetical protein
MTTYNSKLELFSLMLVERIDDLLEELGVKLNRGGKNYYGRCPIHEGDNGHALILYPEEPIPGCWICFTHHCENTFKKNIIGFVRGILSKEEGWTEGKEPTISFSNTIRWCEDFLGQKLDEVRVDENFEKKDLRSVLNI